MARHRLHYALTLFQPRADVFAFFSDAGNLGRITPPELHFEMVTPLPVVMRAGTIIDYRLRLWGVRFAWRTEIARWAPPGEFVDVQREGPYKEWVHHHRFRDAPGGGTVIEDEVHYRLPFEPVSELAHPLVRRQLDRIFRYRQAAVRSALSNAAGGSGPPGSA